MITAGMKAALESVGAGYTQNLYFTPTQSNSPAEVARQTRLATRTMVTRMKGGV